MKVRRIKTHVYKVRGGPRRCKVYCPGCLVCESFQFLDRNGRFPTFEEVDSICDQIMKQESENGR